MIQKLRLPLIVWGLVLLALASLSAQERTPTPTATPSATRSWQPAQTKSNGPSAATRLCLRRLNRVGILLAKRDC